MAAVVSWEGFELEDAEHIVEDIAAAVVVFVFAATGVVFEAAEIDRPV